VNNLIASAVGLVLLSSPAAFAQNDPRDSQYNQRYQDQRQNDGRRDDSQQRSGTRYEDGFRDGYRSGYDTGRDNKRYDDRIGLSSNGDQQARWRQRYAKTYTYTDDSYYQQCRSSPDPAGVIAGALIGGLLGNAVGNGGGRAGTTFAGVILGGAVGATLTKNLDCQDRGFAYRTYYDGFNSGRPNTRYQWYNRENDHNGELRVGDYYNDPDGFRCANFSQVIYVYGRPQETRGRACKQPDGTWAIVG
jgi:surface antigen